MFYPCKAKASPKTGKIPVYLRVILYRQKAEARLNIEVQAEDMKKWNGRIMRFEDRTMSANALLNTIEKKFDDFRHHNATELNRYTAKTIRDIITGQDSKPDHKLLLFIDKYYQTAIEQNAQMAEGTKRNYRKAFTHLNAFINFRKSKDIMLKDVNISFAYEFRDFLLGTTPNATRVGMKECSALDNVKRLRTVFDRAVDEELLSSNPFKKIKLKSKSAPRGRLDISQVKQLYDLDLSAFPTQQIYREMFLFSVFTGLAYADASALKKSNLNLMKDGNTRLFIQREKTDVITEMILPKQAMDIIEKYKGTPESEITKCILPRRSNKEVNVQLKVLANMVNIPIKLSTHIARHTFRQLLAEADICEMGVIKRMMGHSNASEIDGIYYAVTETRLLEAKRKFELYLEKAFNEVGSQIL
jgi:integrase